MRYLEQNNNTTPNSDTYVSPYSVTQNPSDQPVYVSPYSPTYVSPYPPMNNSEPTNTSEQASSNIKTKEADTKPQTGIPKLSWNTQADAFVLAGHSAGKTILQIRGQLALYGYTTSRPQVRESLLKQGIKNFNQEPKQPAPLDSETEIYILNAYNYGQTPVQIATQLCKAGYLATGAIVVASLKEQGVNVQLKLPAITTFNQEILERELGGKADELALTAYGQGQTVSQIANQLCKSGYKATVVQVIAILDKHGVYLE